MNSFKLFVVEFLSSSPPVEGLGWGDTGLQRVSLCSSDNNDKTTSNQMAVAQQILHYFLHFIFPAGIAIIFFRKKWEKTYRVFLLTMLIDADHLMANPVFSACRCSIGFHPLHSYLSIILYFFMLYFPKFRIVAIGLLMHIAIDSIDCLFNFFACK